MDYWLTLGLRRSDRLRGWRWVALAIVLASGALSLHPDARGWRPDHAHASLGAVGTHAHPWDHADVHHHDSTDHGADPSANVAFTEPAATGATAAVALLAAPDLLRAVAGVTDHITVAVLVPASPPSHTPAPPPRG